MTKTGVKIEMVRKIFRTPFCDCVLLFRTRWKCGQWEWSLGRQWNGIGTTEQLWAASRFQFETRVTVWNAATELHETSRRQGRRQKERG